MLIFGIFTAARGLASLNSGFVTVALVHGTSTDVHDYGTETKWRDLMIYMGVTDYVRTIGKAVNPS